MLFFRSVAAALAVLGLAGAAPSLSPSSPSSLVSVPSSPTQGEGLFVRLSPPDEAQLPLALQERLSSLRHSLSRPLTEVPRARKRQLVYELRSALASAAQARVKALLEEEGVPFRSFWIDNSVFLYHHPGSELLARLQQLEEVAVIRPNEVVANVGPISARKGGEGEGEQGEGERALEWNIAHIGADLAWNITRGEGAVVGILDTGVRETHEALIGSYRGNVGGAELEHDYNWFDPKEFRRDPWWCTPGICSPPECCMDTPFDNAGHGTHTCGTAAGTENFGIGVAPGAKWIAAKGCRDGSCLNYGLITSAEWMLCPTTLDGSQQDCSKGADIISNSWGGGGDDDWYVEFTTAWREAGMIPVFSQGNSGPRCETVGSPGDYDHVIGVGAVDDANSLADFSSRGPGSGKPGFGVNKPEICAPGRNIRSSSSTVGSSDNQKYSVSSGTSMSAPHITGTIALMLSANPSLSYDEVLDILAKTATRSVAPPENGRQGSDVCGGKGYQDIPSYHYGQGVVNAYEAVRAASSLRRD